MALKALLTEDEFQALDEHDKQHYSEHEGSFIAQVTPVGGVALEDISGLKKSVSDWKDKANKLRQEREKWSDVLTGEHTVEQIKDALAKVADMDNWDPEKKNAEFLEREQKKMEEALARETEKLAKQYGSEIQSRDERVSSLTGQLVRHMKQATKAAALAEHGGDPFLLGPLLEARLVPLKDDDGNIVDMGVIGEDGEIMKTGPLNRENMSASDFVASLRDDERYTPAFSATRASGSGARGSEGNGRSSAAFKVNDLTNLSQREYEAKRAEANKANIPLQFK